MNGFLIRYIPVQFASSAICQLAAQGTGWRRVVVLTLLVRERYRHHSERERAVAIDQPVPLRADAATGMKMEGFTRADSRKKKSE